MDAPDDAHPALDPFVRSLFLSKARNVVGRAGITDADAEDLAQDTMLRFLERLPAFNPVHGNLAAFATQVANQALANFFRFRTARRRDGRFTRSLNSPVRGEDGETTELGQRLVQGDDRRRGPGPGEAIGQAHLAIDMADWLQKLPVYLRDLAERLRAGDSIAAAARHLGLPRTTVSTWVKQLRERFERLGLRDQF